MGRRPFQRPRSRLRRRDPQDSKPSSSRSPRPPPRTHTALGLTRLLWRNALFLNTFVHVPPTGVCQPPGRRGPGPEPPAQQDVKPGAFRLNGQEPFLLVCDLLHEFAYQKRSEQPARVGPPEDAALSSRTMSLCTIVTTETGPAGEISPEVLTLHHVLQFHPSPPSRPGQRLPRSPEYSRRPRARASAVSSAGRHRILTLVPLSISTPKLPGSPMKPAALKLYSHDSNPHLHQVPRPGLHRSSQNAWSSEFPGSILRPSFTLCLMVYSPHSLRANTRCQGDFFFSPPNTVEEKQIFQMWEPP